MHYGPISSWERQHDRAARRAIQDSKVSLRALAKRHGINPGGALSLISCVAGRLNIRHHGFVETLAEDDGKLGFGHGPLKWWHLFFLGSAQDQIVAATRA